MKRILLAGACSMAAVLALSTPTHAALRKVGTTALADRLVTGTPPQAETRELFVGAGVFFEERIETSRNGRAQVLFRDESSVTLGPGSELVIDRFVYDPEAGSGETVMSFGKGAMRFIGGQISRNSGVEIETPTATIGIRGSIINLTFQGAALIIDALQVRQLNILNKANGNRNTVTQNETRVLVSEDGKVDVQPLPTGGTGDDPLVQFQRSEDDGGDGEDGDGDSTQLGGELATRTDQELSDDGRLTNESSGESSPTGPGEGGDGTVLGGETGDPSDVEDQAQLTESSQDQATDTGTDGESGTTPISTALKGGRVVVTAAPFTDSFGGVVFDGEAQNYTGGPDPVENATITDLAVGESMVTIDLSSGDTLELPIEFGFFSVPPTPVPYGEDEAEGVGFLSADGQFAFYELHSTLDTRDRGLGFVGAPTPRSVTDNSTLRLDAYSVRPDAVWQSPIPGTSDVAGTMFPQAQVSDLLILRRQSGAVGTNTTSPAPRSRALFAAVDIDGAGANQKSLFHVSEGALLALPEGQPALSQDGNGSMRLDAADRPVRIDATYNSLTDGAGNSFFGPDMDWLVLSPQGPYEGGPADTDFEFGQSFLVPFDDGLHQQDVLNTDTLAGSGSGETIDSGPSGFGYVQVAQRTAGGPGLGSRTTRVLNGYAAGLVEAREDVSGEPAFFQPYVLQNPGPSPQSVFIVTDPSSNSVTASFGLSDFAGQTPVVDSAVFTFGGSGTFRGSYVDDDLFAALDSDTVMGSFNGNAGEPLPGNPYGFRSAMATSGLARDDDILPAGYAFCACEYLKWGHWTSSFEWADSDLDHPTRSEYVHLASWVAGELPDLQDIPTSGVATYRGHMIGNVVDGPHQYIAAGGFENIYDFAARQGTVNIGDFDGRDFTGTVNSANGRDYSGPVTTSSQLYHGTVDGSFFKGGGDPVAETGGQFRLRNQEGTYRATGTFAASKP